MDYSIHKIDSSDRNKRVCLYEFINTIEEVDLLTQLAMSDKKDDELIIIMPGWNRGIKKNVDEYKRALKLAEEYKCED